MTTVLRIVIAVLFHEMVHVVITIVVILSVIGLTTVMYINSSSSSP